LIPDPTAWLQVKLGEVTIRDLEHPTL
jgi:hypothetical protein